MTEILTLNIYIITINPFKDEIFNISKNNITYIILKQRSC